MSKKSSKIKNKPRPPPAPGSKREDLTTGQNEGPSEQKDPSEEQDAPSSELNEPSPEQADPLSEQKDPSSEQNDSPPGPEEPPAEQPETTTEETNPPPEQQPANTSSPPPSTTDLPEGNRQARNDPVGGAADKAGAVAQGALPNAGLELPGNPLQEDEKSSLKIKIHLNIHAKVQLNLDAQIYGDIVIGLL
ncbi:hypothetical protein N7478_007837 [Penicillium angulare]|uniref:uncharacterized protein n=1 Tax=Penicillium angulare TaxID=116970 RepID=UPI0025411273|nr:uncharacterized protein N7478_007837 [Penicillium angulare]KAJ5272712.1 hypothetical protein N7478_007837 [Penicillium angulare]